ncbi:glycosyltransferase [Paenibacillus agri]|uniref:Glycosyltransferase n=1 Tax=Paenibacillus agri TaxID=2744309 RepID=A0A850EQM6_9BACL|nr:glycosyltransferase [Paenibacillus agri]NUU60992.1 glycosyltransferase [Paenibacillus agri]
MVVPFDQYQRYKNASDIVNAVREENKAYSILEVGANEHKNLESFLSSDKITYLDIVVPEELKTDPSYIEGDATNMPIETNAYDFVIALDVFEHIEPSRRRNFVSELMRVSKYGCILAAPFNTPEVESAEIRANQYFKTMYGFDYKWLEEHRINGLPEIAQVVGMIKEEKWDHLHFAHGSLELWERMIKIHFLAAGRESLYDYRETIDEYYNTHIYKIDRSRFCYRNFFFISESTNMINAAKNMIDSRNEYQINRAVVDKLELFEKDLNNLSNYDLTFKEIISKNQEIVSKNEEIASKNEEIASKNQEITQKNELVQMLSKEAERNAELLKETEEKLERLEEEYEQNKDEYEWNKKEYEQHKKELVTKNEEINTLLIAKCEQYDYRENQLEIVSKEIEQLKQDNFQKQNMITDKDNYIEQLELMSQQLRMKNRIKKIVPKKLRTKIKYGLSVAKKVKDNPSLAKKGLNELKRNGLRSLNNRIQSTLTVNELTANYEHEDINLNETERIKEEIKDFAYSPLISIIIPVYNVKPKWLELAIKSVQEQLYPFWEICIVDDCSKNKDTIECLAKIDDPRIKVKTLTTNSGISNASNEAISMSEGEYIALLDNDDEITKDALFEVVKAINKSNADLLYSDEDKIDEEGNRKCPLYKPDWSPDLLRSQMYIGHFLVFKKKLFDQVGGFREEFNGSQDYDLVLRMSEVAAKIEHIPKVLYSWRELETSTALNPYSKPYAHSAGLAALNEHLARVFGEGRAYANEDEHLFVYDSRYLLEPIKASIIIPTKDKIDLLKPCISSILEITNFPDYEIIIVNNNSVEQETFNWFEDIQKEKNVKVVDANYEFNWSKLNNHGIAEANGEVFVFLNNDTVIISEDWLQRLVEKAQRDDVGTVGGLLLYEDRTIQHAGVVIGLGGWADHIFKGMNPNHFGSPYVSPMVTRNVIASTGACLAISKKTLDVIGLFNEDFIICGSDVEISLRALQHNLVNIYDPHVRLLHLESKSRSSYIPPIDFELSALHYGPYLKSGDPYFNKNLKLDSLVPKIAQGE